MKKHAELCFVNFSQCSIGENPAVLSTILDGCKKLNILLVENNDFFIGNSVGLVAKFFSGSTAITLFSMANNVNWQNNFFPGKGAG